MSNCIRWVSETAINISLLNTFQKEEEKSHQGWLARIASIVSEALAMLRAAFHYFSNNYNEENLAIRREIRDLMKNAGISALKISNLRAVESNSYSRSFVRVMRDLHRSRLLTQENFNVVMAIGFFAKNIGRAIKNLYLVGLLTQNNFNAVAAISDGVLRGKVIRAIKSLRHAGLLTQENFNVVMSRNDVYLNEISGAIQSLHEAGLLNQENFNAIVFGGGACARNILYAIQDLHLRDYFHNAELLTQENRNSILVGGGAHACGVAKAIRLLHNSRLLTPENRTAILVEDGAYAGKISEILRNLHYADLLTSENRKAVLLGGETRVRKLYHWLNNPPSRLNQELLNRMIRKIEEWECDEIAKILGQRNGRLSDSELELRLPSELIGNIAELGTSHGGPNEYRERAIRLAEEEEQNLLASLEQSEGNLNA